MEEYIVLRNMQRANLQDHFEIPLRRFDANIARAFPPEPKIEVERLDPKDRIELLRDPQVAVATKKMPIKLIKPMGGADQSAQPAWGIRAVGADKSDWTGKDVVVAVLDTGIDDDHPAFAGMDITAKDFTGAGAGDQVGHGTHCAGTIFGRDVDGERIGVARGVQSAFIGKVLAEDGGSSEMLFDGLKWASDNGANVISMSLGFDFPGQVKKLVEEHGYEVDAATSDTLDAYRGNLRMFDVLMEMIAAGEDLGRSALVIAATGNESHRPDYTISAALPAAATGVISVGGVEKTGRKYGIAPFSNSLPMVCAPGVGIRSAKAGGGLFNDSGTSMACPHVAGVAALWWEFVRAQNGAVRAGFVSARMVGNARADVFVKGTAPTDRGAGLVTAP